MSFYPRFANGDFSPLLFLLDEFESQRSDRSNSGTSDSPSQSPKTFSPRFDMREVNDAYLLDGEVPGIGQSDVEIEFTDANTLEIKGHGRRDYENSLTVTGASSEQATSSKSQQPTAEDEAEGGSSVIKVSPRAPKGVLKKYLVSERQVGQFERTFTFPAKVDQDGVKASLKNGIMSIVVPKAIHTAKKITIE